MEFSIDVEHAEGRARIVLHGELDLEVAPQLREALIELLRDGDTIEIDLAGLRFVDSVGLGVLVAGSQRARKQGGDLVLTAITPNVHRLLDLTGLSKVLTIAP